MTSEKLAEFRAKGMLLDPKFDRLAQIGDKKKAKGEEKKNSKILITQIIGPNEVYSDKTFQYKVTKFNRTDFILGEIVSSIKWGYSIDDKKEIIPINQKGIGAVGKMGVSLNWKIPKIKGSQIRVYAWLEKPIKDVSILSNLRIAPPLIIFVNGYYNTRSDLSNPGVLREYWEDKQYEDFKNLSATYFKTRLNQQIFINGADTAFSSGTKRFNNGYNFAKDRLTNNKSNLWEEMMTDKDKDNHFTRPIIVISHSMGGAYAEGMLSFFNKMKLNIIKVIHFSPADINGFKLSYPEITFQIDINPDPVLKYKNFDDRPLMKGIKNACVVENPKDDMYGHDYTKRKDFVWYWFEDLNELKFRPLKTISLPSWGGAKEHQVYELINNNKSKFDLLMKNGIIYMSLEFNLGLKTSKNEYIKAC
jgi:hypothetical protein